MEIIYSCSFCNDCADRAKSKIGYDTEAGTPCIQKSDAATESGRYGTYMDSAVS